MANFCLGLDLDTENLLGKFVVISEENNCDANFAFTSLMWKVLNPKAENTGVVLLSMHQTFKHYSIVSVKLGFNLKSLREKGRVVFVDGRREFFPSDPSEGNPRRVGVFDVYRFFGEKIKELVQNCEKVFIFIDDITDLLYLRIGRQELLMLTHYLRTFLQSEIGLVILTHRADDDVDQNSVKGTLFHASDIFLSVENLRTGVSSDVTGSITKHRRQQDGKYFDKTKYHYKVTDRTVRIFAPGNI